MKYFVTHDSLVPFDYTATELLPILLDNILPDTQDYAPVKKRSKSYTTIIHEDGTRIRTLDDNTPTNIEVATIQSIQECIDSDNVVFKHPLTNRDDMMQYMKAGNKGSFDLYLVSDFSNDIKLRGIVYIISSFTSTDNNSVQVNAAQYDILKNKIRQATIDNILQDLPDW